MPRCLAEIDQRLEGLVDAGEFLLVLVVGVFADGEFLFVGEVAGIDADLLDPLRGFHGGVGLEMDVGDDGHVAPGGEELGLDVLEIGGVLDRRRGDADDFAADLDEVEGLLDAFAGVHRVAGEHRLDADGVGAADADFADLDLAGKAALIVVGIMAIRDGRHGWDTLEAKPPESKPVRRRLCPALKSFLPREVNAQPDKTRGQSNHDHRLKMVAQMTEARVSLFYHLANGEVVGSRHCVKIKAITEGSYGVCNPLKPTGTRRVGPRGFDGNRRRGICPCGGDVSTNSNACCCRLTHARRRRRDARHRHPHAQR